jgi:hypothetical protein
LDYSAAALRLIDHARYCCNSLVDGTPSLAYTDIRYWTTKLNANADEWIHPIVTGEIVEPARKLGMDTDAIGSAKTSLEQLCRFLNALDKASAPVIADIPVRRASIDIPSDINPRAYENTHLKDVPSAFGIGTSWQPKGIDIYLHGSSADLKITPFSDVDDLIILRRNCWQSVAELKNVAERLTTIARKFQDIDPMQHHGHWAVTEMNLDVFDQTFLPLVVLDESVRLYGANKLEVGLLESDLDFRKQIAISGSSINRFLAIHDRGNGMKAFDLKCLAGEMMLVPAKVFQEKGELLSKPEAISRAAELYSPEALVALTWATRVRKEFGQFLSKPLSWSTKHRLRYCPRRFHAQKVMRAASEWVSSSHSLGVNDGIKKAIAQMRAESLKIGGVEQDANSTLRT